MEVFSYLFVIAVWMMVNPIMGFLVYILPLLIALILRKKSAIPISILNVLLGWFFPAWIIFFLWAIFGARKQAGEAASVDYETKEKCCHYCTKFFPKELSRCPHCGKEQRTNEY